MTSENQLLYYPSITYAIIGSSVIFVLVVAFLALVLHHQRKRNNLMTLPVHRLQHPVLLSRLVVLDHPHHCSVTYNVNNGIQYMASQPYHRPVDLDSPPSYSEAVLDQRYVQESLLGSQSVPLLVAVLLVCAAAPHLLLLLTQVQCCASVTCTGSNFSKSELLLYMKCSWSSGPFAVTGIRRDLRETQVIFS